MSGARDIAVKPLPGTSLEQAGDVRARAWVFVFQCWQEKDAERLSSPDARDDTEGSRNDRTATEKYTR